MKNAILVIILALFVSGCANLPIKDGELIFNDKTSATMDEPGVGRVINRF